MRATLTPDSDASIPKAGGRRGFIYFCEDGLHYVGGIRAWAFFAPYLLGVLLLEPFRAQGTASGNVGDWLVFGAYLFLFPAFWQAALRRFGRKGKTNVRNS